MVQPAKNAKVGRIVDHGLDPERAAALEVALDPGVPEVGKRDLGRDYWAVVDWSGLTRLLESSDAGRLELSFRNIERIIGGPLPASSKYQAFWSNSSSYAKAWRPAGFETTRRGMLAGHIAFVRTRSFGATDPAAGPDASNSAQVEAGDIILVGCVKTKTSLASPARDLYQSPMFARRRRYAESSGKPWYILSAEHGLLEPATIVEPYDVYLAHESEEYRRAWGEWAAAKLVRLMGSLRGRVIQVHAGAAYVDAVDEPLRRRGAVLVAPLAGLRQGEQLAWYDRQPGTSPPRTRVETELPVAQSEDFVILDGPHEVGSFTFRLPDSTEEQFDCGWDLLIEVGGARRRVRHGLGTRQLYGLDGDTPSRS